MLKKLLIMLLVTLHCAQASAYVPDAAHDVLMQFALEQHLNCQPDSQLATASMQQRALLGNTAMDKGLPWLLHQGMPNTKPFRLSQRIINWHFLNPLRQQYAKVGLIDQSMQRLWQQLHMALAQAETPMQRSLFLGGLAHLLEDVTVPAHVVPVYHGPSMAEWLGPIQLDGIADYLEGQVMIHDAIDYWPVDLASLQALTWPCVSEQVDSITVLRDLTALHTLAMLNEPIAQCNVTWQVFWQAAKNESYFGRYLHRQGEVVFGKAVQLYQGGYTCELEFNDWRYHHFVAKLHQHAIRADMQLLHWFETQLSAQKNTTAN